MYYMNKYYGIYDFNNQALVHMYNNETELEVAVTAIHELTHMVLSQASSYGAVVLLLTQIQGDDITPTILKNRTENMITVLLGNMIKVQESVCTFMEMVFLKKMYPDKYGFFHNALKDNKKYYITYGFKKLLEEFLSCEELDYISKLINDLALAALNIEYIEMDLNNKSLDKMLISNELVLKINPNARFKKLIEFLKIEIKEHESVTAVSSQEIIKKSGLVTIKLEYEDEIAFLSWLGKFTESLGLADISRYISIDLNKFSNDFIPSTYVMTPNTYKLCKKITLTVGAPQFLYLRKIENQTANPIFTTFNIDVTHGEYCVNTYLKDELLHLLTENSNSIILIDKYYYETANNILPQLLNFKVFINLNSSILKNENVSFINKHISTGKEVMLYEVNDNFFCIFIKGQHSNCFFSFFQKIYAFYYLQYISNNLSYININGFIDNVFWKSEEDINDYEDILYYMINKSWFDGSADKTAYLKYRINLSNSELEQFKHNK